MATKLVNGELVGLTQQEIDDRKAEEAQALLEMAARKPEEARTQRNTLLMASDWTQVADAPVDQSAWATYRQALRDITAQEGFPESINWPVQPV
jgi:hypothetical protein